MDVYRIESLHVDRERRANRRRIRHLVTSFAEDHRIEVFQEHNRVRVRLATDHVSVVLDASGAGCQFEKAVNLLRLHLPDARDESRPHLSGQLSDKSEAT